MKFIKTLFIFNLLILISCSGKLTRSNNGDKQIKSSENNIGNSLEASKYDSTFLRTGWYYVIDTNKGYIRQLDKSTDIFYIERHPIVTAKDFKKLEIYETQTGDAKYIGLKILLNKKGEENWSIATEKSIGNQLAFILDNKLLYVAKVNSQITGGVTAINRGIYTRAELENIKRIIESEM